MSASSAFQLAQLNVGRTREPQDSELLAGFVAALDPVNAAADEAPGFVWRLQDESGDATSIRAFEDELMIVNMSVWESIEALRAFVYSSPLHKSVLRRRREWFERMELYLVLWWVERGHIPSVEEAKERLEVLGDQGPGPRAFTFRHPAAPPGTEVGVGRAV